MNVEKWENANQPISILAKFLREQGRGVGRQEGYEEGRVLGHAMGVRQKAELIAINLLTAGLLAEFVSEMTGLPLETINLLIHRQS